MTLATWRKYVKKRDNHTCRFCGSKYRVEAHHILKASDFPEFMTEISNGITLCHECHLRAHGGSFNPLSMPLYSRFTREYCQPVMDFIADFLDNKN